MEYKKYKRICILDTETTGVCWNIDAPLQIAAIIVDEHGKVIDKFNELIKVSRPIPANVSEINHIYKEDLVNCRKEWEVLPDFITWIVGNQCDAFLTYNGNLFDLPLLNHRCKLYKDLQNISIFDKEKGLPQLDCKMDVTKAKQQNLFNLKSLGRGWKLTKVSELLGIDTEGAHDAYVDVTLLKKVFFILDPIVNPNNWVSAKTTSSLF